MDQGVIAALNHYRSNLLEQLVETVGQTSLQTLAKQLSAGCAGVKYGCPPHVCDAITLLKEASDKVTPSTISACWVHAHCLSVVQEAEVTIHARDNTDPKTYQSEVVSIMCTKLASLTIKKPGVAESLQHINLMPENAFLRIIEKARSAR